MPLRDLFKERNHGYKAGDKLHRGDTPMWSPSRPTSNPPEPSTQKPGSAPMHGGALPMAGNTPYNGRSTYIGKSLLIRGEVSGSEPIHIEGRVEGAISLPGSHISIGRDGMVMSTVQAGEVIVRGTLHGKLTASDRVEIHSGGSLIGEVAAGRISIEDGAYFQGSIDMRRPDPKAHLEINSNKVNAEKRPSAVDEPQQLQALTTS